MHPADEIRGTKSTKLADKKIVLGVTGSIAAVECVRLSRELIRHGAHILPVMTPSATKIIHPDALEFATGIKPIIELTGKTEHVLFCGNVKNPADLLLISPCTSNTFAKIAHGIDDTAVTTFASTAIGSKIPVVIVPAMHISMYNNKIAQKNIEICKKIGINVISPRMIGSKAKIADIIEITENVIRIIGKKDLAKKKILIIGGATAEPVDDIRIFTNKSSGKTAIALAVAAYERNAEVELWLANTKKPAPHFISVKPFDTINDLEKLVKKHDLSKYNTIINCAAISDYKPKKTPGKIPSNQKDLTLRLSPTPKIIQQIRKKAPKTKIIAFKVEETKETIKKKSIDLLKNNKLDFVIGNTIKGFESDSNEIWIIDKLGKTKKIEDKKTKLADTILSLIK